jgi:hypothetical protein
MTDDELNTSYNGRFGHPEIPGRPRPIIFPLLMWLCIVFGIITLLLSAGCAEKNFRGVCVLQPLGQDENGHVFVNAYCEAK